MPNSITAVVMSAVGGSLDGMSEKMYEGMQLAAPVTIWYGSSARMKLNAWAWCDTPMSIVWQQSSPGQANVRQTEQGKLRGGCMSAQM